MSLEPLGIGFGRKAAMVAAGFANGAVGFAGFVAAFASVLLLRGPSADVSIIEYAAPDDSTRYARHLYQQAVTDLGVIGEAHVDRAHPERVLSFTVPKLRDADALHGPLATLRDERRESD